MFATAASLCPWLWLNPYLTNGEQVKHAPTQMWRKMDGQSLCQHHLLTLL